MLNADVEGPTGPALKAWQPYNGDDVTILPLGGDGRVASCPAGFWGSQAQFDWQLYG